MGIGLKTLVIDNYDSFTYNLVHLLAEANQEEPVVVRNRDVSWAELESQDFDNIVVSPGPGRPERAADFGVSAEAILRARVPVLGVCLGHQGIAALHGGSVVNAPVPMHGRLSRIRHEGDELFSGIPSPFDVVRYHSLLVSRPLPEPLIETAWTEDGLLMALRHRSRPLWGVQFHPESILTEYGHRLVENFRDLTHRLRPRRSVAAALPHLEVKKAAEPPHSARRAVWREISRAVDTETAFRELFGGSESAFWLDSSLVEPGLSRWSYLGDAGGGETVAYDMQSRRLTFGDGGTLDESIFSYLERSRDGVPEGAPPCPFLGGHVGWFGYELRGECGAPTERRAETPDAFFIRANRFIAVDHLEGRSFVVAVAPPEGIAAAEAWVADVAARLAGLPLRREPALGSSREKLVFALDRDEATYLADIERCLDWIRQGESYQICLTNRISCRASVDLFALYCVTRRTNPAPHAAFLRWPGGAVLSSSPERFLSVDAAGRVETKPIKGTIRRAADPALDRALADRLRRSEKDRAENLMIVDLLRNDLSRVCLPGSVEVPSLMAVESYATVHQLVSTVRGQLRPGASVVDLMRASFPGGSMTGAPKLRTLDLIDRLERKPRGIYSGALGWLGDDGATSLNIVIRTIVAAGGRLSIGVGGGVTAQSTPHGEFEEMLLKAQASIRAIVTAVSGEPDSDLFTIEGVADPAGREARQRRPA